MPDIDRDAPNWATELEIVRNKMSWRERRYQARLIPCDECGGVGFRSWGVCDNCVGGYVGLRPTLWERVTDRARRTYRWLKRRMPR